METVGRQEDLNVSVVSNGSHVEFAVALEKVLRSKAFSRADSIRHVLKFIVEEAIDGNLDNIKEYSIATEGLGRPADFDPKADGIVRVQVQRLRKRLEEYYNDEGAGDPIRIEIPAGRYVPTFHPFPTAGPPVKRQEPISPLQPVPPSPAAVRMLPSRFMLGLIVVLVGIVALMGSRLGRTSAPNSGASILPPTVSTSLTSLWKPFLPPNSPPLIVYRNSMFLLDDYWGLHGLPPSNFEPLPIGAIVPNPAALGLTSPILSKVGNLYYYDLYTGTGEVAAATQVARFLTNEKQEFSIERSGLVSFGLSRNASVIFLGGPGPDSHLASLSLPSDLHFISSGQGFSVVQDRHPEAGKPSTYSLKRDPKTKQILTDYALISLLPAAVPDRFRLVLAGITTLGTQAAAEFATSRAQMAVVEKMRRGPAAHTRLLRYFQCLLEVQIQGGAATRINCLFVRELQFK
jgi:hypothetical protein